MTPNPTDTVTQGLKSTTVQEAPLREPIPPASDARLAKRIIYFEYDSDQVAEAYRGLIAAHGEFLRANSKASLVLEGHADERGSEKYNQSLSDRRALAVGQLFQAQGVDRSRLEARGLGMAFPAVAGHDESAWSRNRRVVICYRGELDCGKVVDPVR